MLRTLLIGYGAMGRTIAAAIGEDRRILITHILEQAVLRNALQDKLGAGPKVIVSLEELDATIDCAVECAGHAAVKDHVPALLKRGIDVILVSMGSLAEPGLAGMLEAAATEGKSQLTLVPGAVAGIDALAAAKPFGLDRVSYTGRKPPLAWKDTPAEDLLDLEHLASAATFFEGSAREAARRYPRNANVAVTIGITGIGLDATQVRLIADPSVGRNVHSLHAEGAFGTLDMTIANKPLPDNPKTSALAAYSAVRALRNRAAALVA